MLPLQLGKELKLKLEETEANEETAQGTFEIYMTCKEISKMSKYVAKG